MSVIRLKEVVCAYGAHHVFGPVNLAIHEEDRIGLLGLNGAGKSSLMRIIAGEEPDAGSVSYRKNLRIGHLEQHAVVDEHTTLFDLALSGFAHLDAIEVELGELESALARPDIQQDPEKLAGVLGRHERLTEAYRRDGGFEQKSRTEAALVGLGFQPEQFPQPVHTLSGGERARAHMARVLLARPHVLLLDEPTNHLDIESTLWLQETLVKYDKAIVLVSHDADLLDAIATNIWDVSDETVTVYPGTYTEAVTWREEKRRRDEEAYEADAAKREKLESFVEKYRAGQRASQARSRARWLERLGDPKKRPSDDPKVALRLPAAPRSERSVCFISEAALGYGETAVLSDVTMEVTRGQRIGIAGPNGSGKSTLLKAMARVHPPLKGTVHVGRGVLPLYFAQDRIDLPEGQTVLEALVAGRPITDVEARHFLARFLFRGDDVFQRVETLSGGEKSRLALARLLWTPGNFFLLDEPTNHLDIDTCQVVRQAFQAFDGTLVFVTHDRSLLRSWADIVWWVEKGRIRVFERGYDELRSWLERRRDEAVGQRSRDTDGCPREGTAKSPDRTTRKRRPDTDRRIHRQKLADIEREIERLEEERTLVEREMSDPRLYDDPDNIRQLAERHASLEARLASAEEAWLEVAQHVTGESV